MIVLFFSWHLTPAFEANAFRKVYYKSTKYRFIHLLTLDLPVFETDALGDCGVVAGASGDAGVVQGVGEDVHHEGRGAV